MLIQLFSQGVKGSGGLQTVFSRPPPKWEVKFQCSKATFSAEQNMNKSTLSNTDIPINL